MVLGEKIKDPLNHEIRHILLNIILKYKKTGIRLVELSRITGKKKPQPASPLGYFGEEKIGIYKKYYSSVILLSGFTYTKACAHRSSIRNRNQIENA